jgi:glycerol kinase
MAEATALGAAYLAGLAVGYWKDVAEIKALAQGDNSYSPRADRASLDAGIAEWHRAVQALQVWSKAAHSVAATEKAAEV